MGMSQAVDRDGLTKIARSVSEPFADQVNDAIERAVEIDKEVQLVIFHCV
jgi:hypothetical protein